MTLDAGSRLGPYEVIAPLGAGGSVVGLAIENFTRDATRYVRATSIQPLLAYVQIARNVAGGV